MNKTIHEIHRQKNSPSGNPRFCIVFDDETASLTEPDAAFGYSVGNPGRSVGDTVKVTFNNGRIKHMDPVDV